MVQAISADTSAQMANTEVYKRSFSNQIGSFNQILSETQDEITTESSEVEEKKYNTADLINELKKAAKGLSVCESCGSIFMGTAIKECTKCGSEMNQDTKVDTEKAIQESQLNENTITQGSEPTTKTDSYKTILELSIKIS